MKYNTTPDLIYSHFLTVTEDSPAITSEFYQPAMYLEVCQTENANHQPPQNKNDVKYVYSRYIKPYELFKYDWREYDLQILFGKTCNVLLTKVGDEAIINKIINNDLIMVDYVKVDNGTIKSIYADSITGNNMYAIAAIIPEITGVSITYDKAQFQNMFVKDTITASKAVIHDDLKISSLTATTASITSIQNTSKITATSARITNLTSTTLHATNGHLTNITTNMINTQFMDITNLTAYQISATGLVDLHNTNITTDNLYMHQANYESKFSPDRLETPAKHVAGMVLKYTSSDSFVVGEVVKLVDTGEHRKVAKMSNSATATCYAVIADKNKAFILGKTDFSNDTDRVPIVLFGRAMVNIVASGNIKGACIIPYSNGNAAVGMDNAITDGGQNYGFGRYIEGDVSYYHILGMALGTPSGGQVECILKLDSGAIF